MRITAARLGVADLVEAQIAAGCTGIDLSELERRQAENVAAAKRAAAIYARTVARVQASAPVRHGGHVPMPPLTIVRAQTAQTPTPGALTHAAMPPLTIRVARHDVPARVEGGHAAMPPLTIARTAHAPR